MIAGHFGLAAGVKGRAPAVPLWALMLATVWLDVVFVPLLALGIEAIDEVPGTGGGYGNAVIHAAWTHSLVGALALSALFGLVAARWWGWRVGTVLGAVAFSHWLLDLLVHRRDLPILPGPPAACPSSASACGGRRRRRSRPSWRWSSAAPTSTGGRRSGRRGPPGARRRAGPGCSGGWC